jgi:hypothetical protein
VLIRFGGMDGIGDWARGWGLRPAAHRGYRGGRLGRSAAASDGDGCGGGRWGVRGSCVRESGGGWSDFLWDPLELAPISTSWVG